VRTPDLVNLEVGQGFMRLFTLAAFEPNDHVTISNPRVATTYAVRPQGSGTRLIARAIFNGPNFIGRPLGLVDMIMMRKQLLNIKSLAEKEHASAATT
jgi:hypothetical protein